MNQSIWVVEGNQAVPDGYNDIVSYAGDSVWAMLRAVRACRRENMIWTVHHYGKRGGWALTAGRH